MIVQLFLVLKCCCYVVGFKMFTHPARLTQLCNTDSFQPILLYFNENIFSQCLSNEVSICETPTSVWKKLPVMVKLNVAKPYR